MAWTTENNPTINYVMRFHKSGKPLGIRIAHKWTKWVIDFEVVQLLQYQIGSKFGDLAAQAGEYTFFLKYFLENEIFLDNLKLLILIFSNFNCIFLENAIFFFCLGDRFRITIYGDSTLRKIIFKREESRVEGYVTPSCTEMRLSVGNLRKSEKVWELSKTFLRKFLEFF